MRVVCLLLLATFLSMTASPLVNALSSEQRRVINSGARYFDIEDTASTNCGIYSSGSSQLSSNIPSVWRDLINSAAPKYPNVDPRLVAAVLWVENRGWPEYKTSGWGVSNKGAAGPWQFIPTTWASMGQDGDGDGHKDRDNPQDAVLAAYEHHKGSAGLPIAVVGYNGNSDTSFHTTLFQRETTNLLFFAAKYNGRGAPDNKLLKDFPRNENSDYVIMSYWLLATDFTKGYLPDSKKFVDARTTGTLFDNNSQTSGTIPASNYCPSGQGIILGDYSFPVGPQQKSQVGGVPGMSAIPCTQSSCHHDRTPAFDISRQPGGDAAVGAPIYAITNGTVKNIRNSYKGNNGCQSFQLLGDDGYWYWYGHIQSVSVNQNEVVQAGQQIAIIGERRCTGNGSDPHLHIDRGCVKNGTPQPGGRDSCRDTGINEIINSTFNALPE